MDVYEIERYIRNNSIEASTLTNVLLDKLKELTGSYEKLTEVLDDKGYSIVPDWLDSELNIKDIEYQNLQDENKALQDELNVLKETSSK